MILAEILVPLLNANEPEARIVKIFVNEGVFVKKGAILFTLETTKAASDIESPSAGILRLLADEGDTLAVGDRIAVLTDTVEEPIEAPNKKGLNGEARQLKSNGKGQTDIGVPRLTKPARLLAESLKMDLSKLPVDQLVTEEIVRQFAAEEQADVNLPPSNKPYILIFGGGGHAKTVIDLIRQAGEYSIAGIVDDNRALAGTNILGVPVIGTRALLPVLKQRGVTFAVNCVGGILDINIRIRVFKLLAKDGFSFPTLIHPQSVIEPSAIIGEGGQILAKAYIGSDARVDPRCLINTNAVVSHDCVIGQYTHIAPGVLLAGQVQVGERTLVGMGVTTAIGIRIGSEVRIGNGAIILADVPDRAIIQAGRYWTGKAE